MTLRFGVHTGLARTSVDELRGLWRRAEEAGFDWISIWDHFYAADGSGDPLCLEAVSMHAALALTTSRVRCGSLVYSVGYRHPAVLANAAATLDHLSGGRVTLGLGAGWLDAEYRAYGLPFPPAPVRLRQLEEGIRCVRALLDEEVTSFAGEHFSLVDAKCEPKPVQERLPIWIGGGGERVTLRIAAQHADGWNVPFVDAETYRRKVAVLHEHCERLGRDPATIARSVNLALAWDEEDLQRQFADMADLVRPSVLTGSTQEVVDRVGAYRDAGAAQVNVALRAPFDADGMERFAAEVVPAFA
ncbi:MAG: TIGR03560 family F420-dependent LLM class oxidoreductase [Acidimicrobiia bacterium]